MGHRGGSWSRVPVVLSSRAGCSLVPPHPAAEPGPCPGLVLQLCLMAVDGWIQRPILGPRCTPSRLHLQSKWRSLGFGYSHAVLPSKTCHQIADTSLLAAQPQRLPENVCVLALSLHVPCKI